MRVQCEEEEDEGLRNCCMRAQFPNACTGYSHFSRAQAGSKKTGKFSLRMPEMLV